jgi:hypothetical protein
LKEPPKRARKTGADGRTFKYLHKDYAMRHSHTSRISAKTILAFVGLGLAGACSDSSSAPTMSEVAVKAPAAYNRVLGVTSFRYDHSKGVTQRLGDHVLVIPAGGICDLSSSYGMGTWDDPCAPLKHSLIITATTYADAGGHPYIDFQPALRFVPSKETDLYLKDGTRTVATMLAINYCSALGWCVDESINDPSLATHRVGNSNIFEARIKHFSGYLIATGADCNGMVDGGVGCDGGGGQSRSGYMVASGLSGSNGFPTTGGSRRKESGQ